LNVFGRNVDLSFSNPWLFSNEISIFSQDAWIFRQNDAFSNEFLTDLDIMLGSIGCDNRISRISLNHNYDVINPCFYISCIHHDRLQSFANKINFFNTNKSKKMSNENENENENENYNHSTLQLLSGTISKKRETIRTKENEEFYNYTFIAPQINFPINNSTTLPLHTPLIHFVMRQTPPKVERQNSQPQLPFYQQQSMIPYKIS